MRHGAKQLIRENWEGRMGRAVAPHSMVSHNRMAVATVPNTISENQTSF